MRSLIAIIVVFALCGCATSIDNNANEVHSVEKDPMYECFYRSYPDNVVITSIYGDCNDDGVDELTVVYSESKAANKFVTVYISNEELKLTEPMPAPLENCLLQWKDVDEKPPIELLISGQKGIHIGYGVFRFSDGEWVSLYGDMTECC